MNEDENTEPDEKVEDKQREHSMVRSLVSAGFPARVGKKSFNGPAIQDGAAMRNLAAKVQDSGFAENFLATGGVMPFDGGEVAENAFWFTARSFVVRRQRVYALCAPDFVRDSDSYYADAENGLMEAHVLALWGVTHSSDVLDTAWSGEWVENLEFLLRSAMHRGQSILLHGGRKLKESSRITPELFKYLEARITYTPTVK